MLDMHVAQLSVDPLTNMPILILEDDAGRAAVPIWIGLVEASAIATELEKIRLQRPMTHDLMKTIIGECGLRVDRVEVRDVRDNTFYASIFLQRDGSLIEIDSRPSDAIALALRTGSRIRVARKVIEKARRMRGGAKATRKSARGGREERSSSSVPCGDEASDLAHYQHLLEMLSDEDFGKWKM
jgi:uncharacterized protein